MSQDKKTGIYWREETQTFLSEINIEKTNHIILRALGEFQEGVKAGRIVSVGEYFRMIVEPNQSEPKKKPESRQVISDFDAFKELDLQLRELMGNWVPYPFSYYPLLEKFGVNRFILIPPSQLSHAAAAVLEQLSFCRNNIDQILGKLHQQHKGLTHSELNGETVRHVMEFMVRDELNEYGCDDGWFGGLSRTASLYFESIGCDLSEDVLEPITETHFESWIAPSEDKIIRFADEVAALTVKQMFKDQYGSLESDGK